MIEIYVLLVFFDPSGAGTNFSDVATSAVAYRTIAECDHARHEIWERQGVKFRTRCNAVSLLQRQGAAE